jgi:hypothetical protein
MMQSTESVMKVRARSSAAMRTGVTNAFPLSSGFRNIFSVHFANAS